MKLVGERRALASAILAFYGVLYFMVVLLGGVDPSMRPAITALAACYGAAFFALVAGYFWARWFAMGTALFGVIEGAVGMWQMGPEPILLFVGGTHLLAVICLWGTAMSGPYDAQAGWRQKFHIDDHAAHRLGKAIIRAGVSLPLVLLYALAPKGGSSELVAIGAAVLATGGTVALTRLRTWGVAALAGAAVLCAIAAFGPHASVMMDGVDVGNVDGAAAVVLALATLPFARPLARALAR